MPESQAGSAAPSGGISVKAKLVAAAIIAVAVAAASLWLGDRFSLAMLVEWEQQLRLWQADHPVLVFLAALGIYIAAAGLSLPGATPLTLLYGWFFGFVPGVILVSFGSTAGATLAFLSSRYLLRDVLQQRFAQRLEAVNRAIREQGVAYLLTARLIPGIPFVAINLVMGLTPLRVTTFWWVSQLGMLPATVLYVWTGAAFPDLQTLANRGFQSVLTPEIVIAFVCLAMFPLAATRLRAYFRRSQ